MEEWKRYKLEELTIDGKGHYGIGAPAIDYDDSKYTYLRITDINDDGTLNYSGLKSVDDPEASKYLLKEGDIVFARTGNSTGRTYYYEPDDGQFVYAGFLIKFSLDPQKVNPRYLKYYTHSKLYYDWVQSFDTGATRGNINAQTYGAMQILIPSRNVQDRLVDILSVIDNKIKLNNRINHNLEEQADMYLGAISQTYSSRTQSLSNICCYVNEKCNSSILTPHNYISTENMRPNREGIVEASSIPDFKCTKYIYGDTLISNIRPYFKKIWFASQTGGCSNDILCFRSTNNTPSFLYHLLRSDKFFDFVMTGAKGSKMPRGDKKQIMTWQVPEVPSNVLSQIEGFLEKIDEQIIAKATENCVLELTRNYLLPELLKENNILN